MKRFTASLDATLAVLTVAFALSLALVTALKARGKEKFAKSSDAVSKGRMIFEQNCNMCHFPDKTEKKLGPGLKDLFKSKELPASHKPVTEQNVREQVEKGSPNAKPMPMPAYKDKLKPEDMDNLIQYLKTL